MSEKHEIDDVSKPKMLNNSDEDKVWQEALGISDKGTCLRHPNCPVLDKTTNTIVSCRLCSAEEKSAGVQQGISFAAVVKQLQRNTSSKDIVAETDPDVDLYTPTDSPVPTDSSSQNLRFQQPDNLGPTLKRLSQVQNWMLRTKEKEVMSLKMQISKLEQRLADAETTVVEQNQTIRTLRRTIQQDLKLIKTMATQKQLELDAEAEYEAQLQQQEEEARTETDDDADAASSDSMISPNSTDKDKMSRRPSPSKSITSPFPTPADRKPRSRSTSPSPQDDPRLQGHMKFFQRANYARADASIPNRASLGRTRSFEEGIPGFSPASTRSDILTPSGSTYLNESDLDLANDPSKLFASFRGGLLDIPKEPPKPYHATERHKLKIGSAEKSALQVPVRGVLVRTNSAEPTDFPLMTAPPPLRKGKRKNKISVDGEATSGKGIPIDLLASSLNALPLSRNSDDESPDQVALETPKTGAIFPPPPIGLDSNSSRDHKPFVRMAPISPPNLLDIPAATAPSDYDDDNNSDHLFHIGFFDGSVMADARAARKAAEDAGLPTEKFLFSVTSVPCQDKYGDSGTYTGTFLVAEGLPHGTGTLNYDSGRVYSGDWIAGQWNGKGKLLNPNGDTYEGEFVFDARHGKGVYKWDNGDVYTGMFREDKRHGQGKFAFHNGNVYEGEFCDGMFEGFGRYKFNGGYYEGEWKEGRYDGNGELVSASGSRYSGEFRNSVAHGLGMEVTADGQKRRGLWENGRFLE